MNRDLWRSLDNLRGREFRSAEELVSHLKREHVKVSAKDLPAVSQFLSPKTASRGGPNFVPEWLVAVFSELVKGVPAKVICDPWAGVGTVLASVRETTKAFKTLAFNQTADEVTLGRFFLPDAEWHAGDSLALLADIKEDFDIVAANLPFGAHAREPLTLADPQGEPVKLRDDLGHQILAASSVRLTEDGIGIFVVPPKFFFLRESVFHSLDALGLGIEAALALPVGTFAPLTNIETYLVVIRRHRVSRMFVGQLSNEPKTNSLVVSNLKTGQEGGSLELGRLVVAVSFRGLKRIRIEEQFEQAEQRFGVAPTRLQELATAVNLGRPGENFDFPSLENAIYVPLVGNSNVLDSLEECTLKKQNYAQVAIDSVRSDAGFVARFLNSEFGKEVIEMNKTGAVIPKLNKQMLQELQVFVPVLERQMEILRIERKIAAEENTVSGLRNEISELRRLLWSDWQSVQVVNDRLDEFSTRMSVDIKRHSSEKLEEWVETLPFPLASILRAWRATPSKDFKTRLEHLLRFFEATAEFVSVVMLSAFRSRPDVWESHRQKINESLAKRALSFERATFGTWRMVVEYFGKQTRKLLDGNEQDRALCADMFLDSDLAIPEALSDKGLVSVLSTTNKMRNDWTGHGGVIGQDKAQLRNEQVILQLQKVRGAMGDVWRAVELIHALHTVPRRGMFENEVAILMGSNSDFLKETRSMSMWLDVEHLYLSGKDTSRALKLLPLVKVGPSPQSAKNACYFFNRLESDGVRFISYHFVDQPELKEMTEEAAETIRALTGGE